MKISWPLSYKSTKPEAQLAGLNALLGEADEVLMRTYFLQLLPKSQESSVPYCSAHFYAAVARSREEARRPRRRQAAAGAVMLLSVLSAFVL